MNLWTCLVEILYMTIQALQYLLAQISEIGVLVASPGPGNELLASMLRKLIELCLPGYHAHDVLGGYPAGGRRRAIFPESFCARPSRLRILDAEAVASPERHLRRVNRVREVVEGEMGHGAVLRVRAREVEDPLPEVAEVDEGVGPVLAADRQPSLEIL